MKYKIVWILGLCFLGSTIFAKDVYPFSSQQETERFEGLLKQFRCQVCQNQDLSASMAPLALDLKQKLYQKVLKGEQNEEIVHELQARYGDFILYDPPMKSKTLVLWFAPLIFLLSSLMIMWRWMRKISAQRSNAT